MCIVVCIGMFFDFIFINKIIMLMLFVGSYYRTSFFKCLHIIRAFLIFTVGQIWDRSTKNRVNLSCVFSQVIWCPMSIPANHFDRFPATHFLQYRNRNASLNKPTCPRVSKVMKTEVFNARSF